MITYNDVKFIKSDKVDFYSPVDNGGKIGSEPSVSGEMNNLFNETTASEREQGAIKRVKIYIKNTTADRKMKSSFIAVSKDADTPDTITLYEATRKPHYILNIGHDVTSGTTAGTHIAYTSLEPDDDNVVGRKFDDGAGNIYTIAGVDRTNSEIWFEEDVVADIASPATMETVDDDDIYESDEDFSTLKKHKNFPLLRTLSSGNTYIYVATSSASLFSPGDNITVFDNYRRPMYRGSVTSIEDGDDATNKKINIDPVYNGQTLNVGYGYVGISIKKDIGPGEYIPVWVELSIGASNALLAEDVSSFQLEITFDDVSA